jgi:hypothetical protein
MTRAFIVRLALDPSDDITLVTNELTETLSDSFGTEFIDVKPWASHNASPSPSPIEGAMFLGQPSPGAGI